MDGGDLESNYESIPGAIPFALEEEVKQNKRGAVSARNRVSS
jgi:hypothetical protein